MSFATRKLHRRCRKLIEQADALQSHGRTAEALARYQEALGIAEQLADDDPADASLLLQRAVMLRDIGNLHVSNGDQQQALAVLTECERVCRELAGRHRLDVGPLIADVEVQRGGANLVLGRGASAVLLLDRAVNGYLEQLRATDDEDSPEIVFALARALIVNATALMRYGDPDVAAASADMGWRAYLGQHGAPGWHVGHMRELSASAAKILAESGRLERALDADEVAVKAAAEVAEASGSAADRRRLATVLANWALHLRATGWAAHREEGDGRLAESRAIDAAVARETEAEWERVRAGMPRVTLAAALGVAVGKLGRDRVPVDLPTTFTGAPDDGTVSPSGRCDRQLAGGYAATLAGVAADLLSVAAPDSLRIGLEAHYLFAIDRDANPPARDQVSEWTIPWIRLLLTCCRALDTAPDQTFARPLALDLAAHGIKLVDSLPLSALDNTSAADREEADTGRLVRDLLAIHASLLAGNDDNSAREAHG